MKGYFYLMLLAVFVLGCQSATDQVADTESNEVDLEAERAELREADSRSSQLWTAKDVEGIFDLYAADATIYPPDEAMIRGSDGVTEFVAEFTSIPGLTVSFSPVVIEVSQDGDMGYTINTAEITIPDEDGNPITEVVRDFHLWRKQEDGSWKVVVDIWNVEPTTE